jgi:putative hydrolase of the HAD superfamily
MVLIFDLDDTLYDEMSFVRSGLKAVAHFGHESFGWCATQSFETMHQTLLANGRGAVFDSWLALNGRHSKRLVAQCINVYRHHTPTIALPLQALDLLRHYHGQCPLYLVTDGHKIVQHNKIEALSIAPFFKRIFITHRFGVAHAKPSLHCFDIIRRTEQCDWHSMVYVGDNPTKDFVNLNKVGSITIRLLTGSHARVTAKPGYDATHTITSLSELSDVLRPLQSLHASD